MKYPSMEKGQVPTMAAAEVHLWNSIGKSVVKAEREYMAATDYLHQGPMPMADFLLALRRFKSVTVRP